MCKTFTSGRINKTCLRVVSPETEQSECAERDDALRFMTNAGAAALVLGGTVAIVSGGGHTETVVTYTLGTARRLRA